jgi:hypothetical protein
MLGHDTQGERQVTFRGTLLAPALELKLQFEKCPLVRIKPRGGKKTHKFQNF